MKTEAFNVTEARENGLETGQVFHLTREMDVQIHLNADNTWTLVVLDEAVETGSLSHLTNQAKRTENPNFSAKTAFPPTRAWVTPEGVRLAEFVGDSPRRINNSQDFRQKTVQGEICVSCFVQKPLVGGCPTCD